jgi:hypothetical protein
MLKTVWAVVREGKLELLEDVHLPEGGKVLVTLLPEEDEQNLWLRVSERSLAEIWENTKDDVYAELLEN